MKKLLLLGLAALSVYSLQAADVTFTILDKTTLITNLVDGPARVSGVYIYNGHSGNMTYALYDAPATNRTGFTNYIVATGGIQYTQAITTNYSSYLTNWTIMRTNFYGGTNVTTFSNVLVTVPGSVSASAKEYRLVAVGTVAPSNTVSIELPADLYFANGVTYTNTHSTNGTFVRLIYSPSL